MSGFSTGAFDGVVSRGLIAGPILRGSGPPVPSIGVLGSVYIDTVNWLLYERRDATLTNPWGNSIFTVPMTYRTAMKWLSLFPVSNSIGVDGDYCMIFGTSTDCGLGNLRVCGPKAAGVWPGAIASVAVTVDSLFTAVNTHAI